MFARLFPQRVNARSSLIELAGDVWAIDERLQTHLQAIVDQILAASVTDQVSAVSSDDANLRIEDGIAHVPVEGLLVKRNASIFRAFGVPATGYDEISEAVQRASRSEDVEEILLHVDSPGGQVSGLHATGDRIFRARDRKPVRAHGEGLIASAAYWLASQANIITAEEGTEIGSIGVYSVVEDSSRLFESAGITVHVLRAGEHKGVGEPGAKITERQLKKLKASVDRSAAEFVAAVALGRGLTHGEAFRLRTGETWGAHEAVQKQLIDAVASVDADDETQPAPQDGALNSQEASNMDLEKLKAELLEQAQANTEKQLQAVKAESAAAVEALEAKYEQSLAEANAKIENLKAQQKAAMVAKAQAEGRIAPAQIEGIKAYAETATEEALQTFLAALPVVANPTRTSTPLPGDDVAIVGPGQAQLARKLGLPMDFEQSDFAKAESMTSDGKLNMPNGSQVELWGTE